MRVSVIIPVLNEEALIGGQLDTLAGLREAGHELVVVDGGSHDATLRHAHEKCDQLLSSPAGRAVQMHHGALQAHGEMLLFLHVDTLLPESALALFAEFPVYAPCWGRFDVRLSGGRFLFRVIETLMNWRSRITGIATGDQAIFVHRELYLKVGGFPQIALMEDIALSRRLRAVMPPRCLDVRVCSSSRRWEKNGILRTILLMWLLRVLYWLGCSPERLVRLYD